LIQWAAHGQATPVEHLGVDHRRFHVLMAEEFLDGVDVVAVFEQVVTIGKLFSLAHSYWTTKPILPHLAHPCKSALRTDGSLPIRATLISPLTMQVLWLYRRAN